MRRELLVFETRGARDKTFVHAAFRDERARVLLRNFVKKKCFSLSLNVHRRFATVNGNIVRGGENKKTHFFVFFSFGRLLNASEPLARRPPRCLSPYVFALWKKKKQK